MNNNFCFFKLLPLLLALFINVPSFAQISAGGTPPSFRYPTENKILRSAIQLPIDFDITAMRMEDKDREDNKIPPRVGKIIPVYLTTDNSGEWTTLPDGQEIWRLSITAQDAIAIMLTYDKFEIPVGGKLFIYNDDRSRILGAYTEENNPKRVEYATEFVSGDQITLEYAPPFSETSIDTPIIITGVVYGYNYLYTEKMEGGGTRLDFGPSGACMINVICSEGNNWTDQKKGVVRIVTPTGGGYYSLCSGSIVNNTAGDLDPLFLSAFHCYSGLTTNQINQSVYYFHYEHPTCSGRSDPIVPTITGATTLVSLPMNAGSDGYLLRLNEGNPTWFINNGIYFNGWDRRNTAATSGVGIHHPNADVKKISTFTSSLVSSGNINFGEGTTASNSLWRVTWASTTNGHSVTEGGSSGSPIFNQDKRIVGTLTGGSSYCNAPTSPDYYGKLWYHWDQHNTQKMKPYLDPINSNAQFIDGTYTPTGNNYTITATAGTNGTITPSGAVKVASGGSQKFDFTPNSGYEIANVLVNNVSNPGAVTAGFYTFTNVTANHTIHVTFALKPLVCNPPKNLTVSYTTDCKAELTWSAPSKGGVGIPDGEEDDDEGRGISDAAYFTIAGTGAVYKGTVGNVLSGSQIGSAGRDIQCMEYVNGVMYAVSFASGANAFGTINMTTGAWTTIKNNFTSDGVSLSYNPVNGLLYVTPWTGSDAGGAIFGTVNLADGNITTIATYPKNGNSTYYMAIDSDGTAYAVRNLSNQFGTVNLSTGVFTQKATLTFTVGYISNMSFDRETGELYWLSRSSSESQNPTYYRVNKTTGALTQISNTSSLTPRAFATVTNPPSNVAYNIYRDNIPIKTNHTETTYTDTGFDTYTGHTWSVTVACTSGESVPTSATKTACNTISSNADLKSLTVNPGTLNPTFSKNIIAYTVNVANTVTNITITGVPDDPTATVTGNVINASLNVGDNNFAITVTAQDGSTKKTYTVKVIRAASSNANLKSLTVSSGTLNPTFSENIIAYTVNVANTVTNITITGTAADANATVTGNVTNAPLNVGDNNFAITVTAQDGSTKKTYTVKVIRAASSNANLESLTVSSGTLNPAFAPNTTNYTVNVANTVTTITITGTAADANATVTGNVINASLNVGDNNFAITVTAQDGSTKKTYTVKVIRAASANADLKELKVSSGTLTPVFAPNIINYTVNVANSVTNITITGTAADANATVTGNVTNAPLNVGETIFTITVKAQDNTTKNYYVTVVRDGSSNTNLKSLEVSSGTLNPAFAPDIITYIVNVANTVTNITITGVADDPTATVTGNGTYPINVGETIFTITVKAQDNTTKTYYVTVFRDGSSNADLKDLSVSSGTLNPAFAPNIINYTVNVANTVTNITITGVPDDPTATVDGNGTYSINVGETIFTITVKAQDNTTKNYTVTVFRADENQFIITASVEDNVGGVISPAGEIAVDEGGDISFTISPDDGYYIEYVLVDGVNIGTEATYQFQDVTSDHTIAVRFKQSTAIADAEIHKIKVYPNPAEGEIQIENGKLKIENVDIFDIYGRRQKIIFNFQLSTFNLTNLPPGVYFLKIQTENDVITRKIIKQ